MKGPGLKNASPTKLLKPGRRPNKSTLHTGRSTDKISKRPTSTASKAKKGFGNVANQFAKAAKKSLPKIGRGISKAARLGLRGSVAGGAIMAAGESMYKRGKKTGFKPPQFKQATYNKPFNVNKKK